MIEANKIKSAVINGYINGIHGSRNKTDILHGFHESFRMLIKQHNELIPVSLDQWLEKLTVMHQESPELWSKETHYSILNVDQNGSSASVKIEVYKGDTYFSTDYMLLYRFEDGWKIVSKVFST